MHPKSLWVLSPENRQLMFKKDLYKRITALKLKIKSINDKLLK